MNTATQVQSAPNAGMVAAQLAALEEHQYLTFVLGTEVFAIGILGIKEIIEYEGLTAVPMMPSHIGGVINLRGAVVPVMDLSARFGRPPTAATRRTCIVIVEIDTAGLRQDVGIIVDAVNEVLEIPREAIEPPPAFGSATRVDFIRGMGKVNARFVVILNPDRLLSCDEMDAVSSAVADQRAPGN